MRTFLSAYSVKGRHQVDTTSSPSLTKQSFKQECDVNFILSKYQRTGLLDFVNRNEPRYGDASAVDFQDALDTVNRARDMFAELPSKMRRRFDNDPAALLAFLQDERNRSEAIELGLVTPPALSEAPPVGEPSATAPEAPATP